MFLKMRFFYLLYAYIRVPAETFYGSAHFCQIKKLSCNNLKDTAALSKSTYLIVNIMNVVDIHVRLIVQTWPADVHRQCCRLVTARRCHKETKVLLSMQ